MNYVTISTTADICLVSAENPELLIGRPILYLVVDTLTTLIAGFHITVENPSYNVAALALWNAYCDKVECCKKYGITIKPSWWPSFGLPSAVLADRGEMLSHVSDGLIQKLGVRIENTAPYRADAKPLVERMFQQLNQGTITWLEGAKPRGTDPSRDDWRKLARLSINVFRKDVIEAIIQYNRSVKKDYWADKEMRAAGVRQVRPNALWLWGTQNLTGLMKNMDDATVRVGLMPMKTASVTPGGILLDELLYHCPPNVESDWLTRARNHGNWPIEVVEKMFPERCSISGLVRGPASCDRKPLEPVGTVLIPPGVAPATEASAKLLLTGSHYSHPPVRCTALGHDVLYKGALVS